MPNPNEYLAKKSLLDTKQDKLTAGDNITINPNTNVISATDTTYSDVTGATSQTAGAHGLVPAPAAGDEGKFLKGDGTWDTVSAGSASLAGLTDVDLNNPTDGQALVYDATNQEWVNGEAGNADYVELTQQEYDALTPAQQMNGTIYFITDGGGSGGNGVKVVDVLWNGDIAPPLGGQNITLSYTIPSYDFLVFEVYNGTYNTYSSPVVMSTDSLIVGNTYIQNGYAGSNTDIYFTYNSSTSLKIMRTSSASDSETYYKRILGIRVRGGSGEAHYSTDEHIVGTDIDGATIYEQTFTPTTLPALSNTGQTRAINTGLTGIAQIWVESNSLCSNNMPFPYIHYSTENIIGYFWEMNGGNPIIQIRAGSGSSSITITKLTVRYKKSIV